MKADKTKTYEPSAPTLYAPAVQKSPVRVEYQPIELTRRAKVIGALAGIVLTVFGAEKAADHLTPDFQGSTQVKLKEGDNLSDIANEITDGGSSHTGAVVDEIVKRNPDVFQDGKAFVGHEDLGESINVPESLK